MTYKTRFKELEKILKDIIKRDDEIITNHLDEMDDNEFYQRLLDERNYYTSVVNMMKIAEESETKKEFYQSLIEESYINERND